jgi:aspartyl-tRNA(Asn)/glutamyl-tRNA(Gln) amidotransferase subunit A
MHTAATSPPLSLQDNICTAGTRTTAGSQILRDYVPTFDATAVSRLRGAGAVFLGKTNMDEFGMGSSTENSSYKVRRWMRRSSVVGGRRLKWE